MNHLNTLVIFILSVLVINSQCSNILGVFHLKMKSHYALFQSVMTELARRGHNVTVISQFPSKQAPANFTDIDITGCSLMPDLPPLDVSYPRSVFIQIRLMVSGGIERYTTVPGGMFECKPVKQFLNSNHSYDLVVTELFDGDVNLGFVHKFKAPHVALCVDPVYPWGADRMGSPNNPSYIPYSHIDIEFDRFHPTFYQRVYNTICYLYAEIYHFYYSYKTEDLARKVFGADIPRLHEIAKNTSLILSFSHFSFSTPRALVPGVVEIGGVQIEKAKPLPQDIQKFIDESEHGVIYFCLGSMLKIETMPESKRIAFLNAFDQFPQRVVLRWEGDPLIRSERIFTSKWLPQRDILAHPKVKLFIAHGGSLGLNEAIYEGVPVLGIPMFADQPSNLWALKARGAAEILLYSEINNETVLTKINQALQPEYSINMKKVSEIFKDRPMSAIDTAIYWIEYVIRHKGARHLRSAAVDLPLYQYLLLDVICLLLGVLLLVIFLAYFFFKKFFSLFVQKTQNYSKKK